MGKLPEFEGRGSKGKLLSLACKRAQLYGTELRGLDMLRTHGDMLFGTDDPSKIFYRGEPYMFVKEGTAINMTVQYPLPRKMTLA